jgi:hypothetical protein
VYKVLAGKPEGPLGRPRRRWENGILVDLREIGFEGFAVDSVDSGKGAVAGYCKYGLWHQGVSELRLEELT